MTDHQGESLQFLAESDKIDVREVNAVMRWSDEKLHATASPLTEVGLAALTLSITAKLAGMSLEWASLLM